MYWLCACHETPTSHDVAFPGKRRRRCKSTLTCMVLLCVVVPSLPLVHLLKDEGIEAKALSMRQIAHGLFGRGCVDPCGPSEFDVLEALQRTDTKSYEDFLKISAHLDQHSGSAGVVNVAWGDGQSVIGFKNLKKKWPLQFAKWLVAVAGFHEHAHSMFAFTQMFWCVFICWCLTFLNITRVLEVRSPSHCV